MSFPHLSARRLVASAALALIAVAALAGPASAHVTVSADDASRGAADSLLTFRVPNEKDTARTVKVMITFPSRTPIASVKPAAVPGWTITVAPVTFNPPIKTDDGDLTKGVGSITYTATAGGGIGAGEFGAFPVLVGPLPDTAMLAFPTVQTYSDGEVSRWIEPVTDPANEPQNPAPMLMLSAGSEAAPSGSASAAAPSSVATVAVAPASAAAVGPVDTANLATKDDASSGRTLAAVALVAGLVGLLLGGLALARSRAPRQA